jgi:hypothetical protein
MHIHRLIVLVLSLAALSGCAGETKRRIWEHDYPPYYKGERVIGGKASDVEKPERQPETCAKPKAPPASRKPASQAVPKRMPTTTAKPVDGKPGFVWSPTAANSQIDVRGIPPGAIAKDPFSGQEFLVPVQ